MEKLGIDLAIRARGARFVALCAALSVTAACNETIRGDQVVQAPALPEDEPASDLPPMREAPCVPAVTSEPLPARVATMGNDKLGTNEGVHVSQLFNQFKTNCGDCHVTPASLGQFSLTLGDFLNSRDEFLVGKIQKTIQLIRSEDPDKVMPKNGPLLEDRPADHPLRTFADQLEQWLREGRPVTFFPAGGDGAASMVSTFRMAKNVGERLTNLGNCVVMGRAQGLGMEDAELQRAQALDEKFAAMRSFSDLPKSLRETDLTTFDSAELTARRIFNYAPTYTLWADNAKKIRMVRVPVGESVRFDKDSQSFLIPDNTRFYKTFLRQVKDLEGRVGYRKIETRLIIARRATQDADGKSVQTAVFGTYQWNEDESEATLVDTPYRDDEGFQDRVLQVVIDEQLDDEILRTKPKDPLAERLAKGSMRSYAIPGFDRCVQCHMGSPGQDFSLGFTPLQIWRRPLGEGGVFEPAERDELNQLQRLINYGLITGMKSPAEIVPLEASQGDRKPRNEHELNAQGYMLGNCAHCHNPNGFPSQKEQVMKEDLDFLPSAQGGVFQFPLEKFSRRTFRGSAQDIRIPYITPSLYDFTPAQIYAGRTVFEVESSIAATSKLIEPPSKWIIRKRKSEFEEPQYVFWEFEPAKSMLDDTTDLSARPLYAPWRSLVYRNVDAPFTYQEIGTVFPHMPMHTPGYDCRARHLLGTWMVSIPARWKSEGRWSPFDWFAPPHTRQELPNGGERTPMYPNGPRGWVLRSGAMENEGLQDVEVQPYEEVPPDDPDYFTATLAAVDRLARFTSGERYQDCPKPELDILDPKVAAQGNGLPERLTVELANGDGERYEVLAPARPHYFQTDLRLSKRWVLRRGDWYQSLVEGNDAYTRQPHEKEAFRQLREILLDIELDDAWRRFAADKVPFGLWDEGNPAKAMCEEEFERRGVPTVARFERGARPDWMSNVPATQSGSSSYAPNARVFMTSPGEHVFDLICSKCHGSRGDGDSALSSTMADLTGGLTRVANLRDGIFGPLTSPGSNRAIPKLGFGVIQDPTERENWAARYVAWMGLGGTRAYIPEAAVGALRRFTVLGELSALASRFDSSNKADAGNMLKVAKDHCGVFVSEAPAFDVATGLPSKEPGKDPKERPGFVGLDADKIPVPFYSVLAEGLIVSNGHAELWERICFYRNPAPVRVVQYRGNGIFYSAGFFERGAYPVDAAVGAGGQVAERLGAENLAPWCVLRPEQEGFKRELSGKSLPICPEEVTASLDSGAAEIERWRLHGAANAGVAVFLFFDDMNQRLAQGESSPRNVAYDRCQDFAGMK